MTDRDSGFWEGPQIALCARKRADLPALCGAAPFTTLWTNRRRHVGCEPCLREIDRRLAGQGEQRKIKP